MAPPDTSTPQLTSEASRGTEMSLLVSHLARNDTANLTTLLDPSIMEFLGKMGADVTSPRALAYFIVSLHGERGALRQRDIRTLLLSKLQLSEASEMCNLLQLPEIAPIRTLNAINFDTTPSNLELLERWYGVANDEFTGSLEPSLGSQKALASHKLHEHQLNAFRELRRVISKPNASVLVHMPFGAGKLRLVATAALDVYRLEADDRSIVWLAAGAAMCEEAFLELQEVWRQLGSRDTTILQLYGEHPKRDLDQLGGAIAVIDILRLSKDDPALARLGSVTAVAVLADAENLVHPVGSEIVRKMSTGGAFSLIGILATSGAYIPPGSARDALMNAFSGACVTITADNELQALRNSGDYTDIQGMVVDLTGTSASGSTSSVLSCPINDDSLDFDHNYANELGNNVERNERLLEILLTESKSEGRIIFYATTAENARLFAGLLPVQGVKARSITAVQCKEERTLATQKFIARDEKVLCVHGFLLSGRLVPGVSVCVMASPCKSRATFLSTIGRLVQGRTSDLPTLKLLVAADAQADAYWVESLSTWSPLNT